MPFDSESARAAGSKPKREKFITQHLIAELKTILPDQSTKARRLVVALLDKAMDGDVAAAREVMDRVEGKVTQPIGGDEDAPLDILGGLGAAIDSKLDRLIAARSPAAKSEPEQ